MFIKVKVFPNSKKEEVIKKSADSFEVRVRAKAKNGLANKALIEHLANYFHVPSRKLRIIKGARERHKIIEISE